MTIFKTETKSTERKEAGSIIDSQKLGSEVNLKEKLECAKN